MHSEGSAAIDVWAIGEAPSLVGISLRSWGGDQPFAFRLLHRYRRRPAGGIDTSSRVGATPPPEAAARVSCDDSAMARRARCSPPKACRLARNAALKNCVPRNGWRRRGLSGAPVPARSCPGCSRRHDHDKDRRQRLEPEQIARRLPVEFPDDATMRISHEAIHQALFVQGRGALRRELTARLRTGRVLRMPRARTRGEARPSSLPRS